MSNSASRLGKEKSAVKAPQAGAVRVAVRLLLQYSSGEYQRIGAGILLMFAMSGLTLVQPWPLKLIVDFLLGHESRSAFPALITGWSAALPFFHADPTLVVLTLLCVSVVLIQLLAGALNVWSTQKLVAVGLGMVFRLRCAVFDHVQRLSVAFHDSTTVGDSLYRVAFDTYSVQTIFNQGIVPTATAIVTLAGIAGVMLTRDWVLTVAATAVAVPLLLVIRRFALPMAERSAVFHQRESDVTTRVQETLTGIRAVQAFLQEDYETDRFRSRAEASIKASLMLTLVQTTSQFAVGAVLATGTAVVIGISASRALQGKLSPGDVVLMASYVAMLYRPVETLAYTTTGIQQASAGANRVFQLLDSMPDVRDAPDARPLPGACRGAIRFEGVSFAYPQMTPVLHDVSFEIPAGSSLALVGPSGAGKTTLAALLLRFYEVTSGRITMDGVPIRNLTLKSLRSNIGFVSQENILFGASVRENIAYGKPVATFDEIRECARAAGADEFIMSLPNGYETHIGEHGGLLSGGQRQRISLARAFLKNAPILILDEPATGLDAAAEKVLKESLDRLKRVRTTIVIAHNLSMIQHIDQIAVLERGRLVELGTHEQLSDAGGLYARMCGLQGV